MNQRDGEPERVRIREKVNQRESESERVNLRENEPEIYESERGRIRARERA